METLESHFFNWFGVLFFVLIYGIVIVTLPYYRKMKTKPKNAYIAFVIAFAVEMHGIPFSMYIISWIFGKKLPNGILWGHTLFGSVGYLGMYINIALALIALTIILNGWKNIHKNKWSKAEGEGSVVKTGIYRYIRHPQYTGLLLLSLGMLIEWATLSLLLMYPVMVYMYYKLSKREEKDMIESFGQEYVNYMGHTKRFIPFVI